LVTNLLDLSRLESGAAVPAAEWVDVRDLIDAAVADVRTTSEVRAEVDHAPGLPLVRVDATQLQRVLVNLLENAARYSPPGDPVRITAGARGGRVTVSVADHGPGVPESERAHIFRPFYRGAGGGEPGSGLGLAIARGLATANGATLTLEPRDGAGATLTVSIPAAPVPEGRPR
jgi:two-component system, OmpR family, sensor histidine kinase KdpD